MSANLEVYGQLDCRLSSSRRLWIASGCAGTRTKPLARRTLPRGSTERVQELLT